MENRLENVEKDKNRYYQINNQLNQEINELNDRVQELGLALEK